MLLITEDKSTASTSDVFSMNLKDLNLNVPTSESPVDQINLTRNTDPVQIKNFDVQLLKESMRDIEHRHKQEITYLRSKVSDLKAENLNLKETLEKIDKSLKQQFKQIGKLEREINKLQDIHAKCQSSDQ